jgi:hypothetical protein
MPLACNSIKANGEFDMKNLLQGIILIIALTVPAISAEPSNTATTERQGVPEVTQLALKSQSQKQTATVSQAYESYVWFYSVDLRLSRDINGNGYYHRLEVDIDADTSDTYVQVFAEYSLQSRYGKEYIFYTSSVFELFGQRNDDWLAIDTVLQRDYPSDEYLLTIRLFDASSGYLVAEISGYDDSSLDRLPLEDYQRDNYFPSSTTVSVSGGSTSIFALLALAWLLLYRKSTSA